MLGGLGWAGGVHDSVGITLNIEVTIGHMRRPRYIGLSLTSSLVIICCLFVNSFDCLFLSFFAWYLSSLSVGLNPMYSRTYIPRIYNENALGQMPLGEYTLHAISLDRYTRAGLLE